MAVAAAHVVGNPAGKHRSVSAFDHRRQTTTGSSSTPEGSTPTACPHCRSSSIVTTAKTPSSSSYWRCTSCGEIWNDGRHHREDRMRQRSVWR